MRINKKQAEFLMGVVWAAVFGILIALAQTVVSDTEPLELQCPVSPCHLATEGMD